MLSVDLTIFLDLFSKSILYSGITKLISENVSVPVIASGGAGSPKERINNKR